MENTHIDYTWYTQNTKGSSHVVDDKNGKVVGFLGKENCIRKLKEINPDYKISFLNGAIEGDVLCCKI